MTTQTDDGRPDEPPDRERTAAPDRLALTAGLVAAFVGRNSLTPAELPALIANIHAALSALGGAPPAAPGRAPTPAVPVRKSITPNYLVCLEDGKHFKSLKRHLRSRFNLTPDAYRARWNLPPDYPMVAPAYAAARSELARATGLGQRRRGAGKKAASEEA